MKMYYNILVICVLTSMKFYEAYKILLVFPVPMKSHSILGESLVNLLLKAGHEVSYITNNPVSQLHPRLRQIVTKKEQFIGPSLKELKPCNKDFKYVFEKHLNYSYKMLTDKNVQEFIEDTAQTFDLVITEWMMNELYSGFSTVFNCPYIWFFTFHNDHYTLRLIDEYPNPSLTTNMATSNIPPLHFLQRVQELIWIITFRTWKYFNFNVLEAKAYKELFGPALAKRGRALPAYEEIKYNASFVFVNSHLTIRDIPITVPYNYKAIGGIHITDNEPLSQDLLTIIEDSTKGVIIFSLGSFLKAEEIPSNVKRDLLAFFAKMNYTVLWKINDKLDDLPPNVRTLPWIPVRGILAHPKCALFITHGGCLSIIESVHYGVPMVGVPVFADQEVNVKTAVKRGVARMVIMSPRLAYDLKEAIENVLTDPKYKENMMKLSSLYHDRLLSPALELVHWVDHVIATRGAPHLRSPALGVPWYQKCYIDLAVVLLMFLISVLYVLNKIKISFSIY